jgi:hypothetical protein
MLNSAPLGMHYILKALQHTETCEVLTKRILLTLVHHDGGSYFETRLLFVLYTLVDRILRNFLGSFMPREPLNVTVLLNFYMIYNYREIKQCVSYIVTLSHMIRDKNTQF